jgi:hypothetical protein
MNNRRIYVSRPLVSEACKVNRCHIALGFEPLRKRKEEGTARKLVICCHISSRMYTRAGLLSLQHPIGTTLHSHDLFAWPSRGPLGSLSIREAQPGRQRQTRHSYLALSAHALLCCWAPIGVLVQLQATCLELKRGVCQDISLRRTPSSRAPDASSTRTVIAPWRCQTGTYSKPGDAKRRSSQVSACLDEY